VCVTDHDELFEHLPLLQQVTCSYVLLLLLLLL
jgi:hypothetical protein